MVTLKDGYYAPKLTNHIVSLRKMLYVNLSRAVTNKKEFVVVDAVSNTSVRFGRNIHDQLY